MALDILALADPISCTRRWGMFVRAARGYAATERATCAAGTTEIILA